MFVIGGDLLGMSGGSHRSSETQTQLPLLLVVPLAGWKSVDFLSRMLTVWL